MDDNVLEYSKSYHSEYKQKFHDNATEMFDGWVKESKVNVDENRKTAKEYREAKANLENLDKRISKYKRLKGFLIFLVVFGFVATAIGAVMLYNGILAYRNGYSFFNSEFCVGLVFVLVGLGLAIGMLILINKKIKPLLADANAERDRESARAQQLLDTCFEQLRPMYSLYRDSATSQLVQKTVPIIKLDTNFNMRRYDLLSGKYGLGENYEENED